MGYWWYVHTYLHIHIYIYIYISENTFSNDIFLVKLTFIIYIYHIGQKSIRPYWRNYFDNTDALVYVIDSSDRARMEEAGLELTKLLEEDKMQQVPLLVFANKQDLLNAMPADELIGALQLNNIKDREMQVTACSAKNDEGLQPGMEWLVATMNNAQGGGK